MINKPSTFDKLLNNFRDAILQSIRRNKAAAGALLADFRDPGEGAVDGVTAAQEAKYTAEHYLTSNRYL